MTENNLNDFLIESKYCDFSNIEIIRVANYFLEKRYSQTELAKNIFYFVRDSTTYTLGNWTCKASETLLKKSGTCTNNTNLLIALLRAVKIPAGYGVMDVVGPDYFGPIVLSHFNNHVSRKTKHVYCYVYINNKWIKCDPSDDEPLSINTSHINPQSRIVEWNGLSDAMLNINPSHITRDIGPISNIDNIIGKKMKIRRKIPVYFANLYLIFLRNEGRKISRIEDLKQNFEYWLLKRNLLIYLTYKTFFIFDYIIRLNFLYKSKPNEILEIN